MTRTYTTKSRSRPTETHTLTVENCWQVTKCTCRGWAYRRQCYHSATLAMFFETFREQGTRPNGSCKENT